MCWPARVNSGAGIEKCLFRLKMQEVQQNPIHILLLIMYAEHVQQA